MHVHVEHSLGQAIAEKLLYFPCYQPCTAKTSVLCTIAHEGSVNVANSLCFDCAYKCNIQWLMRGDVINCNVDDYIPAERRQGRVGVGQVSLSSINFRAIAHCVTSSTSCGSSFSAFGLVWTPHPQA